MAAPSPINTIDRFNNLARQTKFYQKKEELPKTLFGMEPSGYYWVHLYEYLDLREKRVVTVSPLAVNRNRETIHVSKDKFDRRRSGEPNLGPRKEKCDSALYPKTGTHEHKTDKVV